MKDRTAEVMKMLFVDTREHQKRSVQMSAFSSKEKEQYDKCILQIAVSAVKLINHPDITSTNAIIDCVSEICRFERESVTSEKIDFRVISPLVWRDFFTAIVLSKFDKAHVVRNILTNIINGSKGIANGRMPVLQGYALMPFSVAHCVFQDIIFSEHHTICAKWMFETTFDTLCSRRFIGLNEKFNDVDSQTQGELTNVISDLAKRMIGQQFTNPASITYGVSFFIDFFNKIYELCENPPDALAGKLDFVSPNDNFANRIIMQLMMSFFSALSFRDKLKLLSLNVNKEKGTVA